MAASQVPASAFSTSCCGVGLANIDSPSWARPLVVAMPTTSNAPAIAHPERIVRIILRPPEQRVRIRRPGVWTDVPLASSEFRVV